MTITLNGHLEQLVKRQAAAAGYDDVQQYVRDRLADRASKDAAAETDEQRRAEIRASVDRMVGAATRPTTYEEVAAETRSEV